MTQSHQMSGVIKRALSHIFIYGGQIRNIVQMFNVDLIKNLSTIVSDKANNGEDFLRETLCLHAFVAIFYYKNYI